jgi:two-component system LytT family response regulator
VYVTTTQGAEHFTELTLRTLEEKTPFLRCHRQHLVNPEQIKEISFLETGAVEILTRNNRRIPVSRRLLGELKEKLGLP